MKLKLIKVEKEAKDIKSFFWEPEEKVSYKPGQYFYFTLPKLKYPSARGDTRHFTLSSSPTESFLRFTTKIREESGYKKTLDELKVGAIIEGSGPNGTFILDESTPGTHILLAGGIGITPFRSFLKYNIDKQTNTNLHLIYSNQTREQITFRNELEKWAAKYNNFTLSMTITQPDENQEVWNGLTGRIDRNLIYEVTNKLISPTFWIAGPPVFVESMEQILITMNISGNNICTDKFTGY